MLGQASAVFGSIDPPVTRVMIALLRTFSRVNCLTLSGAVGLQHVSLQVTSRSKQWKDKMLEACNRYIVSGHSAHTNTTRGPLLTDGVGSNSVNRVFHSGVQIYQSSSTR